MLINSLLPSPEKIFIGTLRKHFIQGGLDFSTPKDEKAILAPDSFSWKLFKNPVTAFIASIAAVIMQLAEPRIRNIGWDATSLQKDAAGRVQRTGSLVMFTAYAAESRARRQIEMINAVHRNIQGTGPDGSRYTAADPDLIEYVHGTNCLCATQAFNLCGMPLSPDQIDAVYQEISAISFLFNAENPATSASEMQAYLEDKRDELAGSEIIFKFLYIMKDACILPKYLKPFQWVMVRAAISSLPDEVREITGLNWQYGLLPGQAPVVRQLARFADHILFDEHPAVQACKRVNMPVDQLRFSVAPRR